MDILKVSSKSNPVSVAGAIAGIIREKQIVEVQGIGAGAVNQALKSIAVARGYLAPAGVDLVCVPAFSSVEVDGESKTAMKLIVEVR
ncbi:MAG: stage V sporulation protein S [Oscillospiraceae bacterium]|nr:stage V sporulation protein S [Oscillospiraceae bacterium]